MFKTPAYAREFTKRSIIVYSLDIMYIYHILSVHSANTFSYKHKRVLIIVSGHKLSAISAFPSSTFGNEAVKMALSTQENLREKHFCHTYRLSEPHKPIPDNAEKSFKRKNYLLF